MRTCFQVLCLSLVLLGWLQQTARSEPIIAEFMADNRSSLLDEDGDPSDWIELHNPSNTSASLNGWYLTDDPSLPTQWALPDRTLVPGGHLVIFASGKNRRPAAPAPLHTNFRLDAAGEYLALFRPNGTSATSEFSPAFPPQDPDISFGVPTTPGTASLLQGTPVSVLVPTADGDFPPRWTTGESVAGHPWSGTLGFPLGFDTTPATPAAGTNLALGGIARQSTTGYALPAANGNDGDLNTFTHTATNDDGSSWTLDLLASFEIRRIVLHNRPECCGSRFRDLTVSLIAADGTSVLWSSGLLNPENKLDSPASIELDLLDLGVDPVAARFVRVARTPDPDLSGSGGAGNPDEDSVLSLAEVEVYGIDSLSFAPLLRTDLTDTLLRRNSSALVRVPFILTNPDALTALRLDVRYDDGAVVFLNGQPVLARNAPATLPWNATALAPRNKADSLTPETVDLTPYRNLWLAGTNWLAIHALNAGTEDTDFLVDADLTTDKDGGRFAAYLGKPTPGASNNVTWNLGRVSDTDFSVSRGFHSAPFDLAITTRTPGAEIRYTMDGSVPAADHGAIYTNTIRISQTTVVRAAAFKRDFRPTNVDTHTYVFVESTLAQPARPAGFPANWAGLAPDYAMDPRITQAPAFAPKAAESLTSLPTLSIATDVDNLFGPSRGIYSNPERNGLSWERPISLEWIDPAGTKVFQADAGIRIQGGYFRSRNATHKHSLRLLFKEEYGPGRLREDLFETFGAAREFDTLVLRAGANDGYAWDAARDTEQFLRDEFGRRIHLGMGQPAAHGRFVHLYLNGLYWGLYNLTERPAEDFSATYLGGESSNWDAINSGDVKNGSLTDWNTFLSGVRSAASLTDYQRLKGLRTDGTRDPALPVYLDATNYIDYMLLNIWGGNWDWPNKNFWFGRDRTGAAGGFKFYLWDFENTMGNSRDRSPLEMVSPRAGITGAWVAEPHDRLKRLDEYRIEFADRVQRHCFNGGVLSPESLIARYRNLARDLEPAIIAETARWGDDHHNPPQDLTDWLRERDWILNSYLPRRTGIVLDQLRAAGLLPQTPAPSFLPAGGSVSPSAPVTLQTVAATELFYTTNGLDPRLPGGGVRPEAVRVTFTGNNEPTTSPDFIRSGQAWRYLADGSNPGDAWNQPGFPDASWASGPSPLGYGDGDEATVVPFVDANPAQAGVQKNPTTFFRTSFTVPNPAAFAQLRLTLTYDDAAAVYLNGNEILRTDNLPANAAPDAYASASTADNTVVTRDAIDTRLLKPGVNLVAVEVHQSDPGSSDVSFDLEMVGVPLGQGTLQSTGPLFFSTPTRLMARARRGTEWSALNEALFSPGAVAPNPTNLVISQFCYRPPEPATPAEIAISTDRDDFEYVEFLNVGKSPIDLAGVRIVGGIVFTFTNGRLLEPGQRVLVTSLQRAFEARHGRQTTIAGDYQGRLANDTDTITVLDPAGNRILGFTYLDRSPWPSSANAGFALVLIQPSLTPDPFNPWNWRPSVAPGGHPGESDSIVFTGIPGADADGNGQADLLDHAFGIPLAAPGAGVTAGFVDLATANGARRHLTVSYPRHLGADDAPVVLEIAEQIQGPWRPTGPDSLQQVEDAPIRPGISRMTYRLVEPLNPESRAFIRLSVSYRR